MGIHGYTISLGSVANIPRAIGFFRGINKNKKQNQETLDAIYLFIYCQKWKTPEDRGIWLAVTFKTLIHTYSGAL